jgi:hypothetical protein
MKFKVGDKVICKPGFNKDYNYKSELSGGSLYKEGKIFTISLIDKLSNCWVLWEKGQGCFDQAVELYIEGYEIY